MSKFCYTLSIILVLAKIFGLITLTWGQCILPVMFLVLYKVIVIFFVSNKLLDIAIEAAKPETKEEKK